MARCGRESSIYEGGHRVPTIVSWPGKIRPGETEQTAHSTDWFPTFANLANVSIEYIQPDGVDLLPLLTQRQPLPERNLFWRKNDAWAVRSGPWKLTFERNQLGLYNLESDIGETVDLANSMPEKVNALRSAWEKWAEGVNRSAEQFQ